MRGGPTSQRRIEALTDETVTFRYRDHRDGKAKTMTMTVAAARDPPKSPSPQGTEAR